MLFSRRKKSPPIFRTTRVNEHPAKIPELCPKTGKSFGCFRKYPWLICLFPVIGFVSLIWFLIRVVPKPSRATYPCQRVAFPLASGFIIWLLGLGGSATAFRKARSSFSRSRYLIGILCIIASIGCVWFSLTLTAEKEAVAAEPHPVNEPIGVARGIHPGRVVWVHDPNATDWAGPRMGDGYWWQDEHTDQNVVDSMMLRAIQAVAGELFPRIGFIVTNLRWKSSNVVRFYNKRGTAEQWIKEGKYALKWTRLSCHDFVDNQVRLQLFALAYNLGNFLRRLALPKSVKKWSLRTLREKLIKIGAKVVRHSRYVVFQMAEVVVPRALFSEILERIGRLRASPELVGTGCLAI